MTPTVERINAILDKESNPYKRWKMRKALKVVLTDFKTILNKELDK